VQHAARFFAGEELSIRLTGHRNIERSPCRNECPTTTFRMDLHPLAPQFAGVSALLRFNTTAIS
jgi:hypothetical protein